MASEKKQSESVPMNKLNEVANENYKKLSDEFAKSMRGALYRQYQIYSKNIWNQLRSLTGYNLSSKRIFFKFTLILPGAYHSYGKYRKYDKSFK